MVTRYRLYCACTLLTVALAADANAQLRTFDDPEHDGLAVSYCGAGVDSCGEYMATAWCLSVGYEYASDWAAGVDPSQSAIRLDDGAICEGAECETFTRITCGREARTFTTPVLGPAGELTILSPDQRTTAHAIDANEYRVMMPGCSQSEPGVFICDSIHEYQHCRTLMISRLVFSCRATNAFGGDFARPRILARGEYDLKVDSDASVSVRLNERGRGRIDGDAGVRLSIHSPDADAGGQCLMRETYVFYPTGPEGGQARVGEPADCGTPIAFRFTPHADDLLRAYDLCESFAAWGQTIDDSIDVLAAGLFRMQSPDQTGEESVVAPYLPVEARLTIECRAE